MRALRVDGRTASASEIEGRVLTHDLGPELRKGTVLQPAHVERLRGFQEVHVVELATDDMHEDEAASRLAAALLGPCVHVSAP